MNDSIQEQRRYINYTMGTDALNSRQESSVMFDQENTNHIRSLFGNSVEGKVGRVGYSVDAANRSQQASLRKLDTFDTMQSKLYTAMKKEQE